MKAAGDVADTATLRSVFPNCPRCTATLIAAAASEHVSELQVRHLWSCDACGHAFVTSVRLSASERIVSG